MNPFKDCTQAFGFDRVDHLHESNTALEMCAKLGMAFAILALRPQPNTVGEGRLKPVEVSAPYIRSLIHHQTGEMLPHALAHDASLAMMNLETFLQQDSRNVG